MAGSLRTFSYILPRISGIFNKSKLLGVRLHPRLLQQLPKGKRVGRREIALEYLQCLYLTVAEKTAI